MPVGKYFFIKSKLHGLVLELEGGARESKTFVVPNEQLSVNNDHQLWYVETTSSTIRSKLHDLCLDHNDDSTLYVKIPKPGKEKQQFELAGDRVCQRSNSLMVVDIAEGDEDPGARVCVYEYSGEDNQRWEFEYPDAQFFFIVSELNGLVVDVMQSNPEPGGKLLMWPKNKTISDNQLFYEDKEGRIRSKLNDFLIDASKKLPLKLYPEEFGNLGQSWVLLRNRIVNKFNQSQCMEIKKKSKNKKAELVPGEIIVAVDPAELEEAAAAAKSSKFSKSKSKSSKPKEERHQQWKLETIAMGIETARGGNDDDDDDDDYEDEEEVTSSD